MSLLAFVACQSVAESSTRTETLASDRARSSAPGLDYTIRIAAARSPVIELTARWTGLASAADVLTVTLPESYAFAQLTEPLLEGEIAVRDENGVARTLERLAPYRWQLVRNGARELALTWHARLTQRDAPEVIARRDGYEHPYLDADHGVLVPAAFLLVPELALVPKLSVHFELPSGWRVLTPWKPIGEGAFEPESEASMLQDLVAIGAWSSACVEAGGMVIDVAFAPGQAELERLALEPIRRIVAREVELFGTRPKERYLFVFVKPEGVKGLFIAGSPKGNSMALMVAGDVGQPGIASEIAHLVGHEFHHIWGQTAYTAADSLRFLEEGFTDWFAWLEAWRLGLADETKFQEVLAGAIASYSKARAEIAGARSLTEAGGPKFFEGGADYTLVYSGGLLIAALLDRELERLRAPGGLEAWLRAFKNDARWKQGTEPTDAAFLVELERTCGPDARDRFAAWLGSRSGFDPVAELAAFGVDVKHGAGKRSLRANLDGTRVRDLDHTGEAYTIGVREGDEFLAIGGQAVSSVGDVHRAWSEFTGETLRLRLRRDGQDLVIEARTSPPATVQIDVSPWRR